MLTLALDCSSAVGGLSLLRNSVVLFNSALRSDRSQGEILVPLVKGALDASGLALSDISKIVVTRGPGRFTGIRIALNFAKTLNYCLGIPIYAHDSLTALACQTQGETLPILTMVNAFRNMVFVSKFRWNDSVLTLEKGPAAVDAVLVEGWVTEPCLCLGDGFTSYTEVWSPQLRSRLIRNPAYSDNVDTLRLAQWSPESGLAATNWRNTLPLYLKGSEAEERLRAGLLKPVEELYKLK